jgi:hypothetical protein
MALTGIPEIDNRKPSIYKSIGFSSEDVNTMSNVLNKMTNNNEDGLCVIKEYGTDKILFVCSYDTWNDISIGDISININR